jgi:phosphatidylglycerophosphate synthase
VPATLTGFYPAKIIGVFATIMAVAVPRVRAHHPFPRYGPANVATTVRALLVATVAAFIGETASPAAALGIVAVSSVATALDGVDGWLARRTAMASAFGARFDMELDALLILALSTLVWLHGKAGAWVLASGLMRYGFVAAGRIWPWLTRPIAPTRRARAICVLQIILLLLAMLPAVQPPASGALAAAGLVALAYSFGVDTVRLWRLR